MLQGLGDDTLKRSKYLWLRNASELDEAAQQRLTPLVLDSAVERLYPQRKRMASTSCSQIQIRQVGESATPATAGTAGCLAPVLVLARQPAAPTVPHVGLPNLG